jgi:hypothetical protein
MLYAGIVPLHESDRILAARGSGRFHQTLCQSSGRCHRFFGEDMLAGLERITHDRSGRWAAGDHDNSIDGRVGQQLPV